MSGMFQKKYKDEMIFLTGWTLFVVSVILGLVEVFETNKSLSMCLKIIRYIGYLTCVLKIIVTCIKKKNFFSIFPFIFVLLVSMYKSSNKTLFLYSLVFLAANNISAKRIMKTTLVIQGTILLFTILFSQVGIIRDFLFVRNENLGIYRHSLGFSWTTSAPILFFYCILIYIYLKRNKISIITYVILEGINVWLYLETNSRMAFLLSSLTIFFMMIQKLNKKRWKWFSKMDKLFIFLPFIACGISFLSFKLFNSDNFCWAKADKLLSGRLTLGASAIKKYGFSLFGQNIEWIGYSVNKLDSIGYNYVDNSYLQLGLTYGLLVLFAVLIIYSLVMYKAIRYKDYYLVCIVAIILLFSITEPRLMNLAFNPFPLLFFSNVSMPNDYSYHLNFIKNNK